MTNYCPYCFSDTTLRRELERMRARLNSSEKCDFHPTRKAVPGDAVVELFDRVIRGNYTIAEYHPIFENGSPLVDIIYDLASPEDHLVVTALIGDLIDADEYDPRDGGEPFYAEDQNYERVEGYYNPHAEAWQRFKDEVLHRRRFLSDRAKDYLKRIFEGLHFQRDTSGKGVIYLLPQGQANDLVFRARQLNAPEKREEAIKDPARHLGPPPIGLRRANRMNASGIPAFYGALDQETCLAEIRPPIGCHVVGAAFGFKRPVVVLDVTRFVRPAKDRSLFSPVYRERLDQWQFMQRFMEEVSKPILPDDEALDYVPTQIVSEFLHSEFPVKIDGASRQIDGIIYRSAQNPNGRNIVLFGDAAVVELEAPAGGLQKSDEPEDDWLDGISGMLRHLEAQPALAYSEGSVFEVKVTGVRYTSHPIERFELDDDDDF